MVCFIFFQLPGHAVCAVIYVPILFVNKYLTYLFQRGIQWILIWLNLIGFLLAMVFSGVLTTKACIRYLQGNPNILFKVACSPNPRFNLSFSILIIIFTVIILFLHICIYILKKDQIIKEFKLLTEDCNRKTEVQVNARTIVHVPI